MTTLESTRPYHRLSDVLREDVDAALAGFRVYLSVFRRPARKPATVAPPETKPEQETPKRNTNARADVLALINEQGPLTAGEVAAHLGRSSVWAKNLLFRMRDDHALFIVGNKRNEKHYFVQVYHTDPAYVYVSPEPPRPSDPIIEAKRPARVPSIAAVDRGLMLVEQHFHEDARSKAVFERLCVRPQSVPELEAALRMNDATVRFALQRMIQIGVVCEEEKEATFDQLGRRHVRQVYAVKEAE